MKTPPKDKARRRAKNVRQPWPGKKRRPRASPSADYTHPLSRELRRTIRAWRLAHRLKAAAIAKLARLSRGDAEPAPPTSLTALIRVSAGGGTGA